MSQFFELHTFFKPTCFLPKETLPSREISTFEESVLKYTLNTTESLNHVSSIVVKIPQLSIMFLVGPPKRILFKNLVLLEILSNPPAFIVCQSKSVFLKQRVDTGYATVPTVF